MKNNKPYTIGQGITLKLSTTEALHAVAECYDGPPASDDYEPEHHVALGYIGTHEIRAHKDLGTAIDRMEAQYSGCGLDLDSQPLDRPVGTDLPIDAIAWNNFEIGDQPDSFVHNGW